MKRGFIAAAAVAAVAAPAALTLGVVGLVAAVADDDAPGDGGMWPSYGTLKIGGKGIPAKYAPMVVKASEACPGLPAPILAAQLKKESGFDPDVTSPMGAQGIAQFMPKTWPSWARDGDGDGDMDVWSPPDAIAAQGAFMCSLLRQAKAHPEYKDPAIDMALAGYNAGFGRVVQFRGVPPKGFSKGETYWYVKTINKIAEDEMTDKSGGGGGPVDLPPGFSLPSDTPPQVRTAVGWALQQKGGWYHLGGDCTDAHGPSSDHWCDCSSLMQQAYRAAGLTIPRVTFDQINLPLRVDFDAVKPGDLVFNPGSDGNEAAPGHVGMYIGRGLLIEAPRTGVRTRIVPYASWRHSSSYTTKVVGVRRVVNW
ncbi:C40 family peptidase [Streptomyces sp. NPDC002073]